MNTKKNMIVDKQRKQILTQTVDFCNYNNKTNKYDIRFKNGRNYSYGRNRISYLTNPKVLNPASYKICHLDRPLSNISAIYVFEDYDQKYWHICFENGSEHDYDEKDLQIVKSCLDEASSKNILEYLKQIAKLVTLKAEDGTELLSKQYEKVSSFVEDNTALAVYLNPESYNCLNDNIAVPIFPFGFNASQYKAVKMALENQISVIQGPPGTGKTQTILNIIANLIIEGKTVQVVSNNNSAIENIIEKLASPEYRMDFFVARLGRDENKKEFIKNKSLCIRIYRIGSKRYLMKSVFIMRFVNAPQI